jgi:Flp pilus assembly protein TadG
MLFVFNRLRTGLREKLARLGRNPLQLYARANGRTIFVRDEGAIMLEAAIVLPILVMMFVGMIEFSQAFTARRKVASTAITTADLVAQVSSVSTPQLNDIVSVSNALLAPFSATPLRITITSVGLDANSNAATLWSCTWSSVTASPTCTAPPQGCTATGTPFTLPSGLLGQAGSSIIVTNATYNYKPPMGQFLIGGVTFNSVSYFKPRLAPCVAKL